MYLTHTPLLSPVASKWYFSKNIYSIPSEIKKVPKENHCVLCKLRILANLKKQRKCQAFLFHLSLSYFHFSQYSFGFFSRTMLVTCSRAYSPCQKVWSILTVLTPQSLKLENFTRKSLYTRIICLFFPRKHKHELQKQILVQN